jgi:hypothetical protein
MLKFGVSNFRRLALMEPIELKPITLLVGRNSSGKSSFLRLLPLLRQSLMTRTSSPILWYGDLVDFGNYKTAVTDGDGASEIGFSFSFDRIDLGNEYGWMDDILPSSEATYEDVSLDVVIGPSEKTRIKNIRFHVGSLNATYTLDLNAELRVTSIQLNGDELIDVMEDDSSFSITGGSILPELFYETAEEVEDGRIRRRRRGTDARAILEKKLTILKSKDISNDVFAYIVSRLASIRPFTRNVLVEFVKGRSSKDSDPARKLVADLAKRLISPEHSKLFDEVKRLFGVVSLAEMLSQFQSQLKAVLLGVLYIGPARARSERYYRYQDLAVSEIDPDGKNFPMFLNSLTRYQITQFSDWIKKLFGFGVDVTREGGHISIDLKFKGTSSNIVDTGYGVSQILPVLGQIWWARARRRLSRPELSIIAIEQPELHLHPAHQALLADALAGEVGLHPENIVSKNRRPHFLVETHSETLINRLGELVNGGKINATDVQVVIFDAQDEGSSRTTVKTSSFNERGELVDWPYGFFQPKLG